MTMAKKLSHEVHELHKSYDLEGIHRKSIDMNIKMIQNKKRDVKNHLQKNYYHDVKASYEASTKNVNDPNVIKHIQHVLSIPGTYDM